MSEYISLQEAARQLGLSTKTLRRRIADGSLPAYRAGRFIRVRQEDVQGLLRPIPTASLR